MSDRPDRRDDAEIEANEIDASEIEAKLRELNAEDLEMLQPPPAVWDSISSAVHASDGPDEEPEGRVVPLAPRRRRARRVFWSSAAAAALVIAGVAALVIASGDTDTLIAKTTLAYDSDSFDPLGAQARAGAELIASNGRHRIALTDADLPAAEADADLEAWLIRPDDQGGVADLVSLGLVDPANPGSLAVPSGYDPTLYSVVDISVEPRDGDPAHSGRSILRGVLEKL